MFKRIIDKIRRAGVVIDNEVIKTDPMTVILYSYAREKTGYEGTLIDFIEYGADSYAKEKGFKLQIMQKIDETNIESFDYKPDDDLEKWR